MKNATTIKMAAVAAACLLATSSQAITTDKVELKGNMQLVYKAQPKAVDTLEKAFTEGMLYGRLRMNTFYWDWDKESTSNQDNRAMGLGGSLIYKTAPLAGVSATMGVYTSQNPEFFREDKTDVGYVKAGKDTFDRNQIKNGGTYTGHYGMTVLGQAYLQYDVSKTSFVAGRQIFESVFTKSNDTKMIPNTFDGLSATLKEIPDTTLQMAYFTAQKLRDHSNAHDVIAFDSWNENDDSAVNKSLTKALVGTNNELVIATASNKSLKNLTANVSYALVPHVVGNLALEAHYKIPVGEKWSIAPGFRYMKQMDRLDAAVGTNAGQGVANLAKKGDGYTDRYSLDGSLLALRVDAKNGPLLARLGYSKISDDADIIAPWRGFPTGGFTRAMAQYNWYANTKSYMAQLDYDFGKAGMVDGFKVSTKYAIQDFDDRKPGVQADSNILHVDMIQQLSKALEMKVRVGIVSADDDTVDMNGATKADVSYNEYRLEFNYFF